MATDVAPLYGIAAVQGPTTLPASTGQVPSHDTDGSFVAWVSAGGSVLPITLDTVNNRVGINNATPSYALDVTGAVRATGGGGVSYWVADATSIRGSAAAGGTIYLDASANTTGTINLRATTINLSGTIGVGTISATGNIKSTATNGLVGVEGTGIPGLQIKDNDTGGKDWRIEQGRQVTGAMEFTNLTDSAGTPRMSIRADGKVIMPALPTADPAIAGALWNEAGTLKISAG